MEDVKFSRQIHKNCYLMGYYTTSSGNYLPTFRNNFLIIIIIRLLLFFFFLFDS
jgi:hypothetical protein